MFNQLMIISILADCNNFAAPIGSATLAGVPSGTISQTPRFQLVSDASTLLAEYKKALDMPNDPQARIARCRLGERLLNSHASALSPETVAFIFAQLGRDRCHG
jgi:hypothetical protein